MLNQSIQSGGSLTENTPIALLVALGVIVKRLINALSQDTDGYLIFPLQRSSEKPLHSDTGSPQWLLPFSME